MRYLVSLLVWAWLTPKLALCQGTPNQAPSNGLVERNVPVRMRDGVVLRADVYRPRTGGPYPVLVDRTPYGKQGIKPDAFVKAGYIVVAQDVRGRYASDGQFESFVRPSTHDAEDGYDTVEWAAKLPGSTGKVGTIGGSYDAFLQWRLAALRPPSLVAMSAQSIPARYTDLEGPGTIRPGRRLQWWVVTMSPDLRRHGGRPGNQTSADARALWNTGEANYWLHFLPWLDLPNQAFESEGPFVRNWLQHPYQDPWRLDESCKQIAVPNLDIVGWYDHCNGDMSLFRTMRKDGSTDLARRGQQIIIGPWSHSDRGQRKFGNIDFGPEATLDRHDPQIRWFDHWLKGKPNGVDHDAPVRIFVMGANRWREEAEWPLSRARPMNWYLTSSGHANSPVGDGRLVAQSSSDADEDHYTYDPHDPVPSLFGPAMFTMATDQRRLKARQDILVYQTEPLREAIEITGNPQVELFAASNTPDTDFFARLIDVAPDGLARDISMGMVRARYRHSLEKPELLTPNQANRFVIRLNATSNLFLSGHRIRLDVTSSDFPNYDRNHNTAADQNADATLAVARQTVYHTNRYASKLILPRIED